MTANPSAFLRTYGELDQVGEFAVVVGAPRPSQPQNHAGVLYRDVDGNVQMLENPKLDTLFSEEFEIEVGAIFTPAVMRNLFRKNPRVNAVTQAIRDGEISLDTAVTVFVLALDDQSFLDRGERCPYDVGLAALLVALEDFKEEPVSITARNFSRFDVRFFPLSSKIAKLIWDERKGKSCDWCYKPFSLYYEAWGGNACSRHCAKALGQRLALRGVFAIIVVFFMLLLINRLL